MPAHKTVFSVHLNQIKTTQTPKYRVDKHKLKDEKEITITGPVKIIHPTETIILPYLKKSTGQFVEEIWHMKSLGGSGNYHWTSKDQSVARIGHKATVRSVNIGMTEIRVSDAHNEHNYDTIMVEIMAVHHI